MAVIGLGIPLLILYFQYKKLQTAGKRNVITVLTILQTVFTSIFLLSSLAVIVRIISAYIENGGVSGYNIIVRVGMAVMFIYTVICLAINVMGIISAVLGYKALSNKVWTANAAYNERVTIFGAYGSTNPRFTPPPQNNTAPGQDNLHFTTAPQSRAAADNSYWYCTGCGKKNNAHAKFCPACGKNRNNRQ